MAVQASGFFDPINAFMDYRRVIYQASDQTLKSNRIDLALFENFITGENYQTVDGRAVMAFQYHLKRERDNCGGSINRKIFTLRSYAHFLRLQDVPKADRLPFNDVLKIRQGYRNRPNALTLQQIKCIFASINRNTCLGIRDYAVYALMYQTGLRVGEVHTLDLSSIDLENRTLSVLSKGNKPRQLYITDELAQILCEWIAVRPSLFQSEQNHALFVSKKSNRLAIRTMEDNFKKLLQRSKFETHFNVTCHTLRHSFASHLLQANYDIRTIQELLGHSDVRTTMVYTHTIQSRMIKEAKSPLDF